MFGGQGWLLWELLTMLIPRINTQMSSTEFRAKHTADEH